MTSSRVSVRVVELGVRRRLAERRKRGEARRVRLRQNGAIVSSGADRRGRGIVFAEHCKDKKIYNNQVINVVGSFDCHLLSILVHLCTSHIVI